MNSVEYFINVITQGIFRSKLVLKSGMFKAIISKQNIERSIFRYSAHILYS